MDGCRVDLGLQPFELHVQPSSYNLVLSIQGVSSQIINQNILCLELHIVQHVLEPAENGDVQNLRDIIKCDRHLTNQKVEA